MEKSPRRPFAVSGQEGDENAGDDASPVRPVVDPGKEEAEEDEAHDPSHRLAVDLLPVEAAPALAVVEDGADQAADGGGGADGEGDAGQIGEEEAGDAGPDVEDREAMEAEFVEDERGELLAGPSC